MLASFIITFREFLEAAIVIAVVSLYLKRSGQTHYYRNVWAGLAAGIALSIILALFFDFIYGGLTGKAEKIFEGATMFLAVILLTWMILWMASKRHIIEKIESRVETEISEGNAIGISMLVAIAVLREGVEMIIFLRAASFAGMASFLGAVSGAGLALILSYSLFAGARRIRLKLFFQATNAILILFAAGLTAHGLHEFEEAGLISPVIKPLYDMTWIISKNDFIGAVLNSLFGYTGKPSLTEMAGYVGYFSLVYFIFISIRVRGERKPSCFKGEN